MAEPSGNPPGPAHAARTTHALRRHAPTIKSTRLLRVRSYVQRGRSISSIYCAGVATRTRNVSEYMLVLALCLVGNFHEQCFSSILSPSGSSDRPG